MHERMGKSRYETKVSNERWGPPAALLNAHSPHQLSVKRLLYAAALLMPIGGAHGATPPIRCPGNNTFEMRYCAGKSLEQSGTIYPQLVAGCDDHLNRALLKELQPLGNQKRIATKRYMPMFTFGPRFTRQVNFLAAQQTTH